MALQIGTVKSRVELREEQKTAEAAASSVAVRLQMSDSELMEKIRPIVTQILQEELSRFKRWQG